MYLFVKEKCLVLFSCLFPYKRHKSTIKCVESHVSLRDLIINLSKKKRKKKREKEKEEEEEECARYIWS